MNRQQIITIICVMLAAPVCQSALYFDPAALSIDGQIPENVDLSVFEAGGQLEGVYRVKIYINNNYIDEREVTFTRQDNQLVPTLKKEDYLEMGISDKSLEDFKKLDNSYLITNLKSVIPMSETKFNFSKQKLDISIPQAYISFSADDYVPPSLWDDGINTVFSTYDVNSSQAIGSGDDNLFINLNSGVNYSGWKFRNNSTFSKDSDYSGKWDNISSFVEHDISKLKSRLVIGQTYTTGEVFESFAYNGVRLFSDDNMLPYSQQGISPVINGIANSQATVIIRQNGYVIKQVSVPSGAFIIRDINAINSGSLEVTIRESDGSEKKYIQPWTSIPGMQREDHIRYAFDMGKYRSNSSESIDSEFIQGQAQYGVNPSFTLYGGSQIAEKYLSLQMGGAHSLGYLGALSVDGTIARSDLSRKDYAEEETGQSYRIQYAKFLEDTHTNISIAGYRFSTEGYYDFNEFNEFKAPEIGNPSINGNKKSRVQFLIYQSLSNYGSLYFNAYRQDYWGSGMVDETYSLGYSFSLWKSSFNIGASDTKYDNGDNYTQLSLNITVPFSAFSTRNWLSYGVSEDSNKRLTHNVSSFGSIDKDNKINYNARYYKTQGTNNNGYNVGLDYKGRAGTVGATYSSDSYVNQLNLRAEGSVLVHPWGVTLGQRINDSAILVRAPGAGNTRILGSSTLSTDSNGYALINNVSSYHRNRVGLDTSTLPEGVDVEAGLKIVVPTHGAISLADIKVSTGRQALIKISNKGKNLSFGTPVSLDGKNNVVGIVDEQGFVYMSGLPVKGKIIAKWNNKQSSICSSNYVLPEAVEDNITKISIVCH